ncbi:MAG TPA: DUF6527 family protein [Parasulfuritortus sp.]
MAEQFIRPEFVESAPAQLEDGVLYISDRFHTALHKCCCGCGREVVTPLNPAGWRYIREGKAITLKPSIGNWSFPCKSHYLIIRNRIVWAATMSPQEIAFVKARDARDQAVYLARSNEAKLRGDGRHAEPTLWSWIISLTAAVRRWWSS